jgi:hypothetical protein
VDGRSPFVLRHQLGPFARIVADGEVGGRARLRNLTFGRKYVQIIASISGMALLLAACEPPRPGRGATATPP